MADFTRNIAVAQIDSVLGEIEPNLNKIRHFTQLAASLGAEIVVFPECCTTCYFVGDRLRTLAEAPDAATATALADIARKSRVHLAVGMFTTQAGAVCNSQLLLSPGGKLASVISPKPLITVMRLLKSWATPPASRPIASMRAARKRRSWV